MPPLADLGFPLGIRLTHAFDIVFVTLLIRSGIEILGGHPMLYFNDDCRPGSEWVRFTNKRMFRDQRWTAEDEKQPYTPWLALPGRDNLGLGRFWHFVAVAGWLLTGLVYLLVLFTTGQWLRLVPTSWTIVPQAWEAALGYLSLHLPGPGHPYNALQQLTYFAVVFLLAPLQIATGLAMSPALAGRFPWFPRLFGGRQAARSLHFLGLMAFVAFTVHHVALVIAHGLPHGLATIVLGVEAPTAAQQAISIAMTLVFVAGLVALHVWATRWSLTNPRQAQDSLQALVDPIQARLLQPLTSRQRHRPSDITRDPRPNGRPPRHDVYVHLARCGFDGWRFEIGGLVEQPLSLSLDDLRGLRTEHQITQHKCIQGWSYTAGWDGVPLAALLERCRPTSAARYILFRTFDEKWEEPGHGEYYGVIDLPLARAPQSLLAFGMNGRPLPVAFGAPLRLRLESQLGYKMVKWIRSMELVASYDDIGEGCGGWRADLLHYSRLAPI
ncbi:MAG TPA: molybdopterin-dependent oxidoreductase [Vicinamibacterales bacterium]|nr:molybdopterin-dependent oxidoreductase [Vicinamibacterales bacterium]